MKKETFTFINDTNQIDPTKSHCRMVKSSINFLVVDVFILDIIVETDV